MGAVLAKSDEAVCVVDEATGAKQSTATGVLKVSPLYEGDTTVDLSDPFYSECNINHLLDVIADIDSGRAKLEEHELIEV